MIKKPERFIFEKTFAHGIHFASKLEAAVYGLLKYRVMAGELRDLRYIHSVILPVKKCRFCGCEGGTVTWKVDFSADDVKTGKRVFFEAKGQEDKSYKRRKGLWKKVGPGVLEIWKGSARNPYLDETIIPKG